MDNNLKVCIKIRPILKSIEKIKVLESSVSNDSIIFYDNIPKDKLDKNINSISKYFDLVSGTNKKNIFAYKNICSNIIDNFVNGYNSTLFFYGQTSSGKTYSMLGSQDKNDTGILHYILKDLFNLQNSNNNIKLYISYFEIYNEKILDLLDNNPIKENNYKIIEDPYYGTTVSNIKQQFIDKYEQCLILIDYAESIRKYKVNNFKEKSSRSHTIIKLYLQNDSVYSSLNIIDLAGSERYENISKDMIKENKYINKSLFNLTHCIKLLSQNNSNNAISNKL